MAGADYGAVFVPRIGTEVLVEFEQGDMDRPIIVGALHNGSDLPPFQAGVDSGVDHPGVIAGFHSKALSAEGGDGYNQLILDDTAGQLAAQMASSTQSSQLNLGAHVQRSPGTATRGASRGEGAEMATDGWAVFRAGQGGLVSSTARSQAVGGQLDAQEALGQMKGGAALAQALSDAAEAQGAPKLTTPKDLDDFAQVVGNTVPAQSAKDPALSIPAFSAPALFQETPATAALTSPASIVCYASQVMHVVAQDHVHLASGKTIELASGTDTAMFTHSGGITAIAANGPVSVQAHTDELKVLADQSVTVTSTAGKIEILADKKIVLQAGQGSITLDGGNITFAMPGLFSVKGSQQSLGAAGNTVSTLPTLPGQLIGPQDLEFRRVYASGDPIAGIPYTAKLADGSTRSGTTDGNGLAKQSAVPAGPVVVEYGKDPNKAESSAHNDVDDDLKKIFSFGGDA
jgi:type VI secretion system secreted protein VgrG